MKWKLSILIGSIIIALLASGVFLRQQKESKTGGAEEDKTSVIKEETFTKKVCVKYDKSASPTCKVFKDESYTITHKLSDKVNTAEKYKGYNEIISKRGSNYQIFKGEGNQEIMKLYSSEQFGGENNAYKIETLINSPTALNRLRDFLFGTARAATVTSSNSGDTYIRNTTPTSNLSTEGTFMAGHQEYIANNTRAIVGFTLPSTTGEITNAKIYLGNVYEDFISGDFTTHQVSRADMVFSEVTWNIYKAGSTWTTSGGDYGAAISTTTINTPTANTYYSFDSFISGMTFGSTYIWLLRGVVESGGDKYHQFYSLENASSMKPYLEITYTAVESPQIPANIITFDEE